MDNILIEDLQNKLLDLSAKHKEADDQDAEFIELEAEELIVQYCEVRGYVINGFPTEKKRLPAEALEEHYFSRERYQLYLDTLATQKEDVAILMWTYVSSFWEDQFESKEEYLQSISNNLDSGVFYDVTI